MKDYNMAEITQEKFDELLNKSPQGTTRESLMSTLQERGHNLVGVESTKPFTFRERAKLSFGSPEKIEELKRREEEAGLRGKLDVGDIADIAGSSLPAVGGFIGGALGVGAGGVGAVPGMSIGTGLGEAAKRAMGQAFGVREETIGQEAMGTALSVGLTYSGGKALEWVVNTPPVQAFKNWAVKALPERFYKTFFEVTRDDLGKMWKTKTLVDLQSKDSKLFNQYVEQGIIHIVDGSPQVNPTLAKEIMERGIWGSPEKMAQYAFSKILDLERQVKEQVKSKGASIVLKNKKGYENALKLFIDFYKKTAFGTKPEVLQEARSLLRSLQTYSGNKVKAEIGLDLRRFLDGMRNASSFRADSTLSSKQEGLKQLTNNLRGYLSDALPGFKETMNEYRIFIEAFDSLVDYGYKTGRRQIVSLADAIVGGGGMVAGGPDVSIGLMTLFRMMQMPSTQTGAAQTLLKTGQMGERAFPYAISPAIESIKGLFNRKKQK